MNLLQNNVYIHLYEWDKGAVERDSETIYTRMRNVPPITGWSMKAGQKVSKAGWRDIVVEFGTVPPKVGWLRPMY